MMVYTRPHLPAAEAYMPLMRYAHTSSTDALQSDEGLFIAEILDRVQCHWLEASQACIVALYQPELDDYQTVPPQPGFPIAVHLRMRGPAKPRQHDIPDDAE